MEYFLLRYVVCSKIRAGESGTWLPIGLKRYAMNCPPLRLPLRLGRQIAKAVDEEVVSRDLVPAFVKLLKDSEAEVRSAIAGQIPGRFRLVCSTQTPVLTLVRLL